jgi:hypothetical protein
MYIDYFLKFADEAEANAVLYTTVGESQQPNYAAVDVIGIIYEHTGKTLNTEDGYVPETVPMEGWHVNVRHTAEMPELQAWVVTPKNPVRCWA